MNTGVMSVNRKGFGECALNTSFFMKKRLLYTMWIAQLVERHPAKVDVTGSIPVPQSFSERLYPELLTIERLKANMRKTEERKGLKLTSLLIKHRPIGA